MQMEVKASVSEDQVSSWEKKIMLDMVAHVHNSRTQEGEAEGSPWVPDQSKLQNKSLSQKQPKIN